MEVKAKDFTYYRKRALAWARRFGLTEYQLNFIHEKEVDADTRPVPSRAFIYLLPNNATYGLSPEWKNDPVTKRQLDRDAFHETCHLLLAAFARAAKDRFTTEEELEELEETIVRRLETFQFGFGFEDAPKA